MGNVWCADDTFLGDLYFLTEENLFVDSPGEQKTPTVRDALLSGQAPASVLSSDAKSIPLHAVTRVSTDRHDEDIEIEYRDGNETQEKTLRLSTPEKRDEVLSALKAVYGDRFGQYEEQYSLPRAASGPLWALTIFGGLSWLLAAAAASIRDAGEIEISGGNRGVKQLLVWVLDLLGPTGIWTIGGLLCLLSAMALYNNVKQPPLMITLQEAPYKPHSRIKLVLKYALMSIVWYFALKLVLI